MLCVGSLLKNHWINFSSNIIIVIIQFSRWTKTIYIILVYISAIQHRKLNHFSGFASLQINWHLPWKQVHNSHHTPNNFFSVLLFLLLSCGHILVLMYIFLVLKFHSYFFMYAFIILMDFCIFSVFSFIFVPLSHYLSCINLKRRKKS